MLIRLSASLSSTPNIVGPRRVEAWNGRLHTILVACETWLHFETGMWPVYSTRTPITRSQPVSRPVFFLDIPMLTCRIVALMKRVEATFENHQIPSRVHVDIPKLHPNAIGRLRQAFLKSGDGAIRDSQDGQAAENRRRSSEYDHLESIAARDRNGRFCDLIHWPTPADAA